MIQYVECVGDCHAGSREVPDGSHDGPGSHVASGIIVLPNHEDAGVMTGGTAHQVVQIFKVAVVLRDNRPLVAKGVKEMDRLLPACKSHFGGTEAGQVRLIGFGLLDRSFCCRSASARW